MAHRILLVDDDPSLLRSLERNLCFDYEVATAESGAAALELMHQSPPFEVVLTDMRMPHMDGVQFIEEARRIARDAVYLMLTGNQDLETAIHAVNQGQVFRFLCKPSEIDAIRQALAAGVRQFELIHAEKELLQSTFVGAVNVLTNVLEALRPDLVQHTHDIDIVMRALEDGLGFAGSWEYRLAVKLGFVGLALQPPVQQARFQHLAPTDRQSKQLLDDVMATTARLIERIPRLEPIVAILRAPVTNGAILSDAVENGTPGLGALLLRVATYWTSLLAAGRSPLVAEDEIRQAFPKLPSQVSETLIGLECERTTDEPVRMPLEDLAADMVLAEDVISEDGSLLMRSGSRLSAATVEKLRLHNLGVRKLRPIFVFKSSCRGRAEASPAG